MMGTGLKDLKVLKCRGCRLQNINPQVYNLLNQLTDLDLGNNQVIYCSTYITFACQCVPQRFERKLKRSQKVLFLYPMMMSMSLVLLLQD